MGILEDWVAKNNQPATTEIPQQPGGMIGATTNWQNTPDQTVQGQTANIIAQDSPLMQLASTQGAQQAASRGLLNSSIGIGAAQDAVYKAATPIASADATQAARVAGYNVDTQNKANEFNATNQFNREQQASNNAYDMQKTLVNNQNSKEMQTQNIYSGLADNYAKSIVAINQDPNMTQKAKTYAISQLYDAHKANLTILASAGQVPDIGALLTPKKSVKAPGPNYKNYHPPAAAGGGKMICTRCYALGLMDSRTYLADDIYSEVLKVQRPSFIEWYWSWAYHVVNAMHCTTIASRVFTKLAWVMVVNPWSKQMSKEMGFPSKGSRLGKFYMVAADMAYKVGKWLK